MVAAAAAAAAAVAVARTSWEMSWFLSSFRPFGRLGGPSTYHNRSIIHSDCSGDELGEQ